MQIGIVFYFLFMPFCSLVAQDIKESILVDSIEAEINHWTINIRRNTYTKDLDQLIIIKIRGDTISYYDFWIDIYLNKIKMLNKGYLKNHLNELLVKDVLQEYHVYLEEGQIRSKPSRIMIKVKDNVNRISQGYITSSDEKFISRIQKIISYDLTTGEEFIENDHTRRNKINRVKSRKSLRKRE